MPSGVDPLAIDVGRLVRGTVSSLHAHLVTRPTGRAVRMEIESRVRIAAPPPVSLIDLSEIAILDFSCADEVVAKLIQRYQGGTGARAFFVFRGAPELHLDQIEVALSRQGLVTVAEVAPGSFELLGARTSEEERAWSCLEEVGRLAVGDGSGPDLSPEGWAVLSLLVRRGVAYPHPERGEILALSRIVEGLGRS